ncbi:MAG: glutamate synthase, partial [Thermoanaerobaculia bacterium]|nr:glutamate synthase [Thermoanaerobaculia bacterium]
MPALRPYPFGALVRRMLVELDAEQAIFDLPVRRFVTGNPHLDLAVDFHGRRPASPLGPAAGPQTQMAQNIVLSWLGGCRIQELKTVQIDDELEIPRPCIDVHTVGLNAEWSQELKLEESLEEYVKGAMLVEILRQSGAVEVTPGFEPLAWDMSVGYDLAGIRSPRVQAFIESMLDCRAVVERLRRQIPEECRALRDLDYPDRLSDTLTLSTFHGCPPDEIERIIDFLMRQNGLHCIVKFNPMLLGPEVTRELLHDELGYDDLAVPESAFERDTTWSQAVEIVGRLGDTARELGLSFGVKFSNTLIVENTRGFLAPAEKEVYLSGQPLHVLAMHLVRRFRREFGDRFPISFAAGIDRLNYPDAAALGLAPITVCTDLLRKGGYGRLAAYQAELERRMGEVGARSIDELSISAYGRGLDALESAGAGRGSPVWERCRDALAAGGDLLAAAGRELFARWVSEARLANTETYVEGLAADERYTRAANSTPPRKIGSHLELFDCISCDICIPVCPNDANFAYRGPEQQIPVARARRRGDGWEWRPGDPLKLARRHQIGTFLDVCNECGNCDICIPV